VLGEPIVEALEGLAGIRIGGPGERFGVAEGGLLCFGVEVGLPPRGQRVDLRARDRSVAGGLVVEVVIEAPSARRGADFALTPPLRSPFRGPSTATGVSARRH
jgi:hypothetical protein